MKIKIILLGLIMSASNVSAQYTQIDLIEFNTQYGLSVESAPSITPAFHNYHQDIGGGGSRLGNLALINGETIFTPDGFEEYPDIQFRWYINDSLVSELTHPKLNEMIPICDGVVRVRLDVEHLPTSVIASREEWAYLDYNAVESCPTEPNTPCQFCVFYEFYPDVEPYFYSSLRWDLNGDGSVNMGDNLILLSGYGVE